MTGSPGRPCSTAPGLAGGLAASPSGAEARQKAALPCGPLAPGPAAISQVPTPRVRCISVPCLPVVAPLHGLAVLTLALQTAGDAGDGLLIFGLDMASLQQWTLIYLGVSSMAFVLVWVIGFLRR